jgi:hypothetical protein
VVDVGPSGLQDETVQPTPPVTVEDALAQALSLAARAQRWDIVAQLARELEARRLAASGVTSLADARKRWPTND